VLGFGWAGKRFGFTLGAVVGGLDKVVANVPTAYPLAPFLCDLLGHGVSGGVMGCHIGQFIQRSSAFS
jgi:hypothetical protein